MTDIEQIITNLQYMKHNVLEGSDDDRTLDKAISLLKEQRTTVEVVSVTKENGSVNLFAFRESKDAIKCFCYWKEKGATVTSGEVDIQ